LKFGYFSAILRLIIKDLSKLIDMKLIYTAIFAMILSISTLQAQNDPFEGMNLLEELFGDIMGEMGQALEDSKMQMEYFELQNLGDGKMYIDGDTVNISGMFRMLSDNMQRMPEQLRPNDEHLENMDETAKILPDLLMKSAEMFKSGTFEELFGEMFNEIGIEIPEVGTPRQPDLYRDKPSDEPRPTGPKDKEEKKPLKKMKYRKTITI